MKFNHGDTETQSEDVDFFPDAVCPLCESGAAIRVPASMVGKSHDFILCYACGRTSVVEGDN